MGKKTYMTPTQTLIEVKVEQMLASSIIRSDDDINAIYDEADILSTGNEGISWQHSLIWDDTK